MPKRVTASDAKNNFGGLLEDVATLGRVEIVKRGRLVAVILSPQALEEIENAEPVGQKGSRWGEKHMIPPASARAARRRKPGSGFNDE